jgi:alanyl-tRNA synthetase
MTTKLYWQDSHLTNFTACVQAQSFIGDKQVLVLDQTAFYPTGGGQPCDLGTLNSARVCDVTITSDGTIQHHLATPISVMNGEEVTGAIDWGRRQEFLQQHTGQHILSQSFFQLFGAETRGFRLNAHSSEIDLTLDATADEISRQMQRAEDLANEIVFANREIRALLVTPEVAARMPLRKETFVTDCVRIIEIEDFDWSACGGTHAKRTGEVGLITIKHWERAKQMIRVEFLCGVRALRDYRAASFVSDSIARHFSVARDAAPESVARLIEENKDLKRRGRLLAETAVKYEAEKLRRSASGSSNPQVILSIQADRSFEEMKLLAHQLVKADSIVALIAVAEKDAARLVFARSANVNLEMGALMREACQALGGRGGGASDFAQGGVSDLAQLEPVLKMLGEKLTAL